MPNKKRGPIPMRVEVRGKVYKSAKTAARFLGVEVSTVYCAISRRTTTTVGMGKGNRTNNSGGRPKKPFRIAGLQFDSQRDAERALGLTKGFIAHSRKYKNKARLQAKLAALAEDYIARQMQEVASGERRLHREKLLGQRNYLDNGTESPEL